MQYFVKKAKKRKGFIRHWGAGADVLYQLLQTDRLYGLYPSQTTHEICTLHKPYHLHSETNGPAKPPTKTYSYLIM